MRPCDACFAATIPCSITGPERSASTATVAWFGKANGKCNWRDILVTSWEVLHPSSYWAIFTIINPAFCQFLQLTRLSLAFSHDLGFLGPSLLVILGNATCLLVVWYSYMEIIIFNRSIMELNRSFSISICSITRGFRGIAYQPPWCCYRKLSVTHTAIFEESFQDGSWMMCLKQYITWGSSMNHQPLQQPTEVAFQMGAWDRLALGQRRGARLHDQMVAPW